VTTTRRSGRRSPLILGLAGLAILGALAAAAGFAYLFLRDAPPPAVGIVTPAPGSSAGQSSAGPDSGSSSGGSTGSDGTWTIDSSIGSFSDFTSSFVGYRVDETFTGNRANTAVGRTPAVSGSLVLDGSTITSVDVTADLTQLKSDDDRRDGQLQRQAIETSQFPTATFHLTSPIALGSVPMDGQSIDASATGELTLHGVTKSVTVPIRAQLSGDVVTVTGSIDILFADYGIEQPTSFVILSIEDHGTMELKLHFRRG
jgi:polyisoprenoid-binding protein YceI